MTEFTPAEKLVIEDNRTPGIDRADADILAEIKEVVYSSTAVRADVLDPTGFGPEEGAVLAAYREVLG